MVAFIVAACTLATGEVKLVEATRAATDAAATRCKTYAEAATRIRGASTTSAALATIAPTSRAEARIELYATLMVANIFIRNLPAPGT
jgi:hypothetical protein